MIKHITHKMKNWIAKFSYKITFLVQVATKNTFAEFQNTQQEQGRRVRTNSLL